MKNLFLLLALSLLAISCIEMEAESEAGPNKPVVDRRPISDVNLEGVVGGSTWTFIKGRVKPSKFSPDKHSFDFWDENFQNECDDFTFGGDRNLMGSFTLTTGTINFENMNNLTFFYNNRNLIATDGRIEIIEITDTHVRGKMIAQYDSQHKVSGNFELILCD